MGRILVIQDTLLYNAIVARNDSTLGENSRWESQLRKGSLDLAILAILWEHRRYGLEIIRELKAAADVELAEGTLYPILLRLTQESLLHSEWVDADSGHQRKYYRLSERGRRRAIEMMHAWEGFSAAMSQLTQKMRETAHDRNSQNVRPKVRANG
jgi:PadR family transcriptional regulator PadR